MSNKFMLGWSHLSVAIAKICLWISGLGMVIMTAIIFWQVVARYGFNASPPWSEQLSLYILIWTVLFSAAAGVREQFHIKMTVTQDSVPILRGPLILFAHFVTGCVGACLLFYGIQLVSRLWAYSIPTLNLPRGSGFIPIPFAGALFIFFTLEHVVAIFRKQEVKQIWDS